MMGRTARGADSVTQALQAYADRGVFRGFSVRPQPGGAAFRFTWLTTRPMTVVFDSKSQALTFRNVLPGVLSKSPLFADVKSLVAERARKGFPAHRQIDPRRARVSFVLRQNCFSLTLHAKRPHHRYAVQKGLNLINEVFILLHASYPDYLSKNFGLPEE